MGTTLAFLTYEVTLLGSFFHTKCQSQDELSGIVAALKGIGSVSERSNIERTLDKLYINSDAVVSMREPVIIDLASHYKGQLTEKIELVKRAILETRLIEFDSRL